MSREPQGPQEPRTEAGRELLRSFEGNDERFTRVVVRLGILAIEAEAATPAPGPRDIDMERLAQAMHTTEHPAVTDCRLGLTMEPRPEWSGERKCVFDARRLAAEYRRLSGTTEPPREAELDPDLPSVHTQAVGILLHAEAVHGCTHTVQARELLGLGAAGTTEPPPRDHTDNVLNDLYDWLPRRTAGSCTDRELGNSSEDLRVADSREALRERVIEAAPIDALAVWAVRYALGRMTYAVSIVTETLIAHAGLLRDVTRRRIVSDIDEAMAKGNVGMDMDRQEWKRLRAALAALDSATAGEPVE